MPSSVAGHWPGHWSESLNYNGTLDTIKLMEPRANTPITSITAWTVVKSDCLSSSSTRLQSTSSLFLMHCLDMILPLIFLLNLLSFTLKLEESLTEKKTSQALSRSLMKKFETVTESTLLIWILRDFLSPGSPFSWLELKHRTIPLSSTWPSTFPNTPLKFSISTVTFSLISPSMMSFKETKFLKVNFLMKTPTSPSCMRTV